MALEIKFKLFTTPNHLFSLNNGPYVKLSRNPLQKIISDVRNNLKQCSNEVPSQLKRKC